MLLPVLPAADVVRFERMARRVGGRLNSLALLPAACRASAVGLARPSPTATGLACRSAAARLKGLGRCARLFDAGAGVLFALHAGDRTVAAFVGLRTRPRAHSAARRLCEAFRVPRFRLTGSP